MLQRLIFNPNPLLTSIIPNIFHRLFTNLLSLFNPLLPPSNTYFLLTSSTLTSSPLPTRGPAKSDIISRKTCQRLSYAHQKGDATANQAATRSLILFFFFFFVLMFIFSFKGDQVESIVDFGIRPASFDTNFTRTGQLMGSPELMSLVNSTKAARLPICCRRIISREFYFYRFSPCSLALLILYHLPPHF